jgi:hypothetical protein
MPYLELFRRISDRRSSCRRNNNYSLENTPPLPPMVRTEGLAPETTSVTTPDYISKQ